MSFNSELFSPLSHSHVRTLTHLCWSHVCSSLPFQWRLMENLTVKCGYFQSQYNAQGHLIHEDLDLCESFTESSTIITVNSQNSTLYWKTVCVWLFAFNCDLSSEWCDHFLALTEMKQVPSLSFSQWPQWQSDRFFRDLLWSSGCDARKVKLLTLCSISTEMSNQL